jgi:hypothetical protein
MAARPGSIVAMEPRAAGDLKTAVDDEAVDGAFLFSIISIIWRDSFSAVAKWIRSTYQAACKQKQLMLQRVTN